MNPIALTVHRLRFRFPRSLVLLTLALPGLPPALAQTAPPRETSAAGAETTASSPSAEEVLKLNPFTVTSEKEEGYLASSTLAGTRLNTPLKDLGAAISVLTTEFISDLGITDTADILAYATGTEVGGMFGNFTGEGYDRSGDNSESRTNPSDNNRSRGLAGLSKTRNYFTTDIPGDTYNVSDLTLSRGPNAILAGMGSPGGSFNSGLKTALFRNSGAATLGIGSHGTRRETLDLNQQLIPQRLAFRVALLDENKVEQQDPAHMASRRIYGAVTWRLHRGQGDAFFGDTTFRTDLESGHIDGTPANPLPPIDSFSPWWADGKPSYRATPPVGFTKADGTSGANLNTTNAYFRNFAVFLNSTGAAPLIGYSNPAYAGVQGFQGTIPNAGGLGFAGAYQGSANINQVFNKSYGLQRMTDAQSDIFNFRDHLLTGSYDKVDHHFRAYNIRLEQLFWGGRAGLELVADQQRYARSNNLPFKGQQTEIKLDLTTIHSNGQPNPNYGRPFIISQNVNQLNTYASDNDSWRATAFYNLKFSRGPEWLRNVLGRHTFTGVASGTTVDTRTGGLNSTWMTDDPTINLTALLGVGPGLFARNVMGVVYMGDSVANVASPSALRLSPVSATLPHPGDVLQVSFWDPNQGRFRIEPMTVTQIQNKAALKRQSVDSYAASVQSYWLKDSLISLVGWRRDSAKSYTSADPALRSDGNVDLGTLALPGTPGSTNEVKSMSYSLVGVFPQKLLFKLPFDSDLRVHWSKSQNFTPSGERRNSFNEEIGAPIGKTEDYGFSVSTLNRKVDLRVNWFKTTVSNATNTGATDAANAALNYTWTIIQNMINAQQTGLVPADFRYPGFASFNDIALAHFNSIPARTRIGAQFNFQPQLIRGSDGNYTLDKDNIVNLVSTSEQVARGLELELALNPTRNWRIAVNASRNETVNSGVGHEARAYIDEYLANLQKISPVLLTGDRQPGQAAGAQFQVQFRTMAVIPLETAEHQDGSSNAEVRKWRWNLLNRYSFSRGWLKGAYIGGSLRWQDKAAIGYPLITDSSGLAVADLSHPFFDGTSLNGDVLLGYRKDRLFHSNVGWTVQLNVRNVIGPRDLIAVVANPDGSLGTTRIPPPRAWMLTNTFRF